MLRMEKLECHVNGLVTTYCAITMGLVLCPE